MRWGLVLLALVGAQGCASSGSGRGGQVVYEDHAAPGRVGGLGIQSNDIVHMAHQMANDLMASPVLARRRTPPKVVIDAEYFRNESASVINKNMITDLLRVQLSEAAAGRIIVVGREYAAMLEDAAAPSDPAARSALAWDYRLAGRIASLDSVDPDTQVRARYQQFTFELVERATGAIQWSGSYQLRKTAQDDVLYR